jgi:hypothetical protein
VHPKRTLPWMVDMNSNIKLGIIFDSVNARFPIERLTTPVSLDRFKNRIYFPIEVHLRRNRIVVTLFREAASIVSSRRRFRRERLADHIACNNKDSGVYRQGCLSRSWSERLDELLCCCSVFKSIAPSCRKSVALITIKRQITLVQHKSTSTGTGHDGRDIAHDIVRDATAYEVGLDCWGRTKSARASKC